MLLFTFYWQELVSGTLELSPFLTRSKIPAAVVITVLLVLETISSSMRAVEFDWNTLTTVTAYVNLRNCGIVAILLTETGQHYLHRCCAWNAYSFYLRIYKSVNVYSRVAKARFPSQAAATGSQYC
jgi:hypothetical protein